MDDESNKNAELVCSLTDAEFRERRTLIRTRLLPHITGRTRLNECLRLTFPAELQSDVEAIVQLERQCCGFLNFTIEQVGNEISLTIQGPAEAASTLEAFAAFTANSTASGCGARNK